MPPDWEYVDDYFVGIETEGKKRLRVYSEDGRFSQTNIARYIENDSKTQDKQVENCVLEEEPKKGKFGFKFDRYEKRVFTMVYQLEEPKFNTDVFYKYWVRVERHVEQDSGVLFMRKSKKKCAPIETIQHWQKFLECCESQARRFIQECVEKGYIARLLWMEHCYWVVNSTYCWNGRYTYEPIASQFYNF